jgi:hypothetical protein
VLRSALQPVIAKLKAMDSVAIRPFLRAIGRLAYYCVWEDVAEAFSELAQQLERSVCREGLFCLEVDPC